VRCYLCEKEALSSIEGWSPDVPEFGVCADHTLEGLDLVRECQFQQVCLLNIVSEEDINFYGGGCN
jgi:hypothetical protein